MPHASADVLEEHEGDIVPILNEDIGADLGYDGASGIDVSEDGTVYVAAAGGDQVYTVDSDGSAEVMEVDDAFDRPSEVVVTQDGALYVAQNHDLTVSRVEESGDVNVVHTFDESDGLGSDRITLAAGADDVYAASGDFLLNEPEFEIVRIGAHGSIETIVDGEDAPDDFRVRGMDVDESGMIHVAAGDDLFTVSPAGAIDSVELDGAERSLVDSFAREVAVGEGQVFISGDSGVVGYGDHEVKTESPAMNIGSMSTDGDYLYFVDRADPRGVWKVELPLPVEPSEVSLAPQTELSEPSHPELDIADADPGAVLRSPRTSDAPTGEVEAQVIGMDGVKHIAARDPSLSGWNGGHQAVLAGDKITGLEVADDGSLIALADGAVQQIHADDSVSLLHDGQDGMDLEVEHIALGDEGLFVANEIEVHALSADRLPSLLVREGIGGRVEDIAALGAGGFAILNSYDKILYYSSEGDLSATVDLGEMGMGRAREIVADAEGVVYVGVWRGFETEDDDDRLGAIVRVSDQQHVDIIAGSDDEEASPVSEVALDRSLKRPSSLAVDGAGNVHFVESRGMYILTGAADAPAPGSESSGGGADASSPVNIMLLLTTAALGIAASVLWWVASRSREIDPDSDSRSRREP